MEYGILTLKFIFFVLILTLKFIFFVLTVGILIT